MSEVTRILLAIEGGDDHAASELLPLVYDELRRLAAQKLAREKPGQTLQATALVHEAYVRLVDGDGERAGRWEGRGHFFAAAAEAMRRILIDSARRKKAEKHGGGRQRLDLDEALSVGEFPPDDLLALDEVLARLETVDPLAARVVTLRYFAGLTMPEAAKTLGLSLRNAERNWTYARAWLRREMSRGDTK